MTFKPGEETKEDRMKYPKTPNSQPELGVSESDRGSSCSPCGGEESGKANAEAATAASPTHPGLPQALTVRRLLHQPPILTEVICGFA